jgi:hypothetical protein
VGERHKKVRRCRKKELLQAASGEERVRVAEEQVRYGTRKPHTRQEDPESCNEAAEAGIAGRPRAPIAATAMITPTDKATITSSAGVRDMAVAQIAIAVRAAVHWGEALSAESISGQTVDTAQRAMPTASALALACALTTVTSLSLLGTARPYPLAGV